jgi:hypothetical protein
MRPRIFALLAITVAVSVLVVGSIAQAADNQVGTWKLDVAKSKYNPGPAKEGTLTIEAEPNGYKITVHGTSAEGNPIHFEMSPKFDGKDYPMTGNPDADLISMKKIDDYTVESRSKKGEKPAITTRSVVSKDGKTRTSTQTWKNAKGQNVKNTLVYDKQ